MNNKGMVNKGKYWIFEKNKGISVSNFKEPKVRNKEYPVLDFIVIGAMLSILLIEYQYRVLKTKGIEY